MESLMDAERALIESFVVPWKRERYVEMLTSPKRRKKFLRGLYHFPDLDPRYCVAILPAVDGAAGIAVLLRRLGAGDICHVISTDATLDGRSMPLDEALAQVAFSYEGTLISCIPGKLGYFEGENMGDRCILKR